MTKPRPRVPAAAMCLLMLCGCTGVPDGVTVVKDFDLNRYLGTWYEIARLDHRFERGLSEVTATYTLGEDGGVRVVNRGYNAEHDEWKDALGKAYFVDSSDTGRLKVSFFGPFYGGYNIFALDPVNYSYSMVTGPDRDYLWILSRSPDMDPVVLSQLLGQAKALGFATEELIFVEHAQ